jgi:hypothetical protein
MRLAYERPSGDRGFTSAQFQLAAEEVAGKSLAGLFKAAPASTEEFDYADALDWLGLQFSAGEARVGESWTVELLPDATLAQWEHLRAWTPETPRCFEKPPHEGRRWSGAARARNRSRLHALDVWSNALASCGSPDELLSVRHTIRESRRPCPRATCFDVTPPAGEPGMRWH